MWALGWISRNMRGVELALWDHSNADARLLLKTTYYCNRYDCSVALGANAYANSMSACASLRAGDKEQTSNLSGACFLLWTWNMVGHRHCVSNAAAWVWTPRLLLQGKHSQSKKSPHIFGAPGVNNSQIFVIQIHKREIPKNALDHKREIPKNALEHFKTTGRDLSSKWGRVEMAGGVAQKNPPIQEVYTEETAPCRQPRTTGDSHHDQRCQDSCRVIMSFVVKICAFLNSSPPRLYAAYPKMPFFISAESEIRKNRTFSNLRGLNPCASHILVFGCLHGQDVIGS